MQQKLHLVLREVDHVPAVTYLPLWLLSWRRKLPSPEYGEPTEVLNKDKLGNQGLQIKAFYF